MPAYKDKQRGTWYANFYYTDWMGNKKHKCKRGFKTQREAKEYERSFLDKGSQTSDILFESLVENYFKDIESRLKPTTIQNKQNLFETKITPYFKNLKVCDITSLSIRSWQNTLLAYRDEDGKPYSNTYLKTIHNQISSILNYAVKHYGLPGNPCHVTGSIGKKNAGKMKIWTQEEFEQFIALEEKPGVKLAFDILFYTGMRSGEVLALTPADIKDKRININKNYARLDGEDIILTPKTSKSVRSIAIPDFLNDEINDYVSKLYGIEENDRIFYFTRDLLQKDIKSIAKKAGIQEIRVHDLRHSHASMLIEMGFDILEISERLGHESVKTTWDTYSHLYPDKDVKMAEKLNSLRVPK